MQKKAALLTVLYCMSENISKVFKERSSTHHLLLGQ